MYGDKCRDYNDLGGERLKLLLSSNALHHCGRVCARVHMWMYVCEQERSIFHSVRVCVCVCRAVVSRRSEVCVSCQCVCAPAPGGRDALRSCSVPVSVRSFPSPMLPPHPLITLPLLLVFCASSPSPSSLPLNSLGVALFDQGQLMMKSLSEFLEERFA